MKLEELLGEELFAQVQAKIDAVNAGKEDKLTHVRYADLSEGGYVSKAKHDALQALLDGKTAELDTANGLIADLKKGTKGDEELQGKVTAYESQVEQLQEQLKQTQISSELKIALLAAGAKADDIDYLDFKLQGKGEKLELGEDGKIKGIDDKIAGLKTQFPKQFEAASGVKKVEPNPLQKGDERKEEPQTLADALRQQYEPKNN